MMLSSNRKVTQCVRTLRWWLSLLSTFRTGCVTLRCLIMVKEFMYWVRLWLGLLSFLAEWGLSKLMRIWSGSISKVKSRCGTIPILLIIQWITTGSFWCQRSILMTSIESSPKTKSTIWLRTQLTRLQDTQNSIHIFCSRLRSWKRLVLLKPAEFWWTKSTERLTTCPTTYSWAIETE